MIGVGCARIICGAHAFNQSFRSLSRRHCHDISRPLLVDITIEEEIVGHDLGGRYLLLDSGTEPAAQGNSHVRALSIGIHAHAYVSHHQCTALIRHSGGIIRSAGGWHKGVSKEEESAPIPAASRT